MEYSCAFIGELVTIKKNCIGFALDSTNKSRAIRLVMGSTFLVLDVGENDDRIPDAWKLLPVYKIFPLDGKTYDDFSLLISFVPVAIYVDPESIDEMTTNSQ